MFGFGKSGRDDAQQRLERRLGVRFRRQELLARALTHRSWAHEKDESSHYERLEFLGDAVLGLIAAEWLFERYPESREGKLSLLRSHLVNERVLAEIARELGLGEFLRLGIGEERSGGREKNSILADAMEALLGALFIDRGLESVRGLVAPRLDRLTSSISEIAIGDGKTRLQEWSQARGWALPEYRLVAEEGPAHERTFTVECWLEGERRGQASGASKKAAEQGAAGRALAALAEGDV